MLCDSSLRSSLFRIRTHGFMLFRSALDRSEPVRSGMVRCVRCCHRAPVLLQMRRKWISLLVEGFPWILIPRRATPAMTRHSAMRHRDLVLPCLVTHQSLLLLASASIPGVRAEPLCIVPLARGPGELAFRVTDPLSAPDLRWNTPRPAKGARARHAVAPAKRRPASVLLSITPCAPTCSADQHAACPAPIHYRDVVWIRFACAREATRLRPAGAALLEVRWDCRVLSFAFDFLS